MTQTVKHRPEWTTLTNIADYTLGTRVIYATDDFFAEADRMLQPADAVFIDDKYDDNGKWMDGWETRRRRDGKNDFCLIKLGVKSQITGFNVDTSHFTGNYAPAVSIAGCNEAGVDDKRIIDNEQISWVDLVKPTDLGGNTQHFLTSLNKQDITHLKVTLYPDGGIARLRAYGTLCFDESLYQAKRTNVISALSGARAIYANDEHFGSLKNILRESEPLSMADGWETRRRREPGYDWGIVALPRPAVVDEVQISTRFFKGNFPHQFSICAGCHENVTDSAVITKSMFWQELIKPQGLTMNSEHTFDKSKLVHQNAITHIRINMFPDGGIARLKLFGRFIH